MSGWDYGKTPNVWRPSEVQVPGTGADLGVGAAPIYGPVTTTTITEYGYPPLGGGGGTILKTVFDNQGTLGTVTGTVALTTIFSPTSVPISIYPYVVLVMLYQWTTASAVAHNGPVVQFQVRDGGGITFQNLTQWNSPGSSAAIQTLSCGGVGIALSAMRLFMINQTSPSFIEGRTGVAGGTNGQVSLWSLTDVLNNSDNFFADTRVNEMRVQVQPTRTDDTIILQRISLYGLLQNAAT